jgi:hypothetical protein
MWRSVAAFAPINETFAGIEVDIPDLDVEDAPAPVHNF